MGPTKPLNIWVSKAPCTGIKQSRHEADHSRPSTVELHGAVPPLSDLMHSMYVDAFIFTKLSGN
jgi:hypothetical protein